MTVDVHIRPSGNVLATDKQSSGPRPQGMLVVNLEIRLPPWKYRRFNTSDRRIAPASDTESRDHPRSRMLRSLLLLSILAIVRM